MSLEQLISEYGYVAIGVGSLLEGETIVVLGGFSAHLGYLELQWVILAAFLGSFIGDQFYFYIGRLKGRQLLEKRPAWQKKSVRVLGLLSRHQNSFILGFRFLYGLRTATPFLIGAANISPARFFVLNFLGAVIWAITIGALGYFFGNAMQALLGDLKHYEILLFVILAGLGGAIWLAYRLKQKFRS